MKLLFDQNLSPKLAANLKEFFDESLHLQDLEMDSSNDFEVWEYAKKNDFTIVTKDIDFNNMVSLLGFPPKVIWLRRGNCPTNVLKALLLKNLDTIKTFISDSQNGIFTIH